MNLNYVCDVTFENTKMKGPFTFAVHFDDSIRDKTLLLTSPEDFDIASQDLSLTRLSAVITDLPINLHYLWSLPGNRKTPIFACNSDFFGVDIANKTIHLVSKPGLGTQSVSCNIIFAPVKPTILYSVSVFDGNPNES